MNQDRPMTQPETLPLACPFCDAKHGDEFGPMFELYAPGVSTQWKAVCVNCGVQFDKVFTTEQEAIEHWNRRPQQSAEQVALHELREMWLNFPGLSVGSLSSLCIREMSPEQADFYAKACEVAIAASPGPSVAESAPPIAESVGDIPALALAIQLEVERVYDNIDTSKGWGPQVREAIAAIIRKHVGREGAKP